MSPDRHEKVRVTRYRVANTEPRRALISSQRPPRVNAQPHPSITSYSYGSNPTEGRISSDRPDPFSMSSLHDHLPQNYSNDSLDRRQDTDARRSVSGGSLPPFRVFVNPDRNGHFDWLEGKKQLVGFHDNELPQASPEYKLIARCLDLGLAIHESRQGLDLLASIGREIVQEYTKENSDHIYRYSMNDMHYWTRFFLDKLRTQFPNIYLTHTDSHAEVIFLDQTDTRLDDYVPKNYFALVVNKWNIDNTILASSGGKPISRETIMDLATFHIGKVFAHEIVHAYGKFLAGNTTSKEPLSLCFGARPDRRAGELGQYWEFKVFGGKPEPYYTKAENEGRGRVCWTYMLNRQSKTFRRLDLGWLVDTVRKNFSWPPLFESQALRIKDLAYLYYPASVVEDIPLGRVTSGRGPIGTVTARSDNPPSMMRYNRPPPHSMIAGRITYETRHPDDPRLGTLHGSQDELQHRVPQRYVTRVPEDFDLEPQDGFQDQPPNRMYQTYLTRQPVDPRQSPRQYSRYQPRRQGPQKIETRHPDDFL